MSELSFAAMAHSAGFAPDPRYAQLVPDCPLPEEPDDPVAAAFATGFAEGHAAAEAAGNAALAEALAARGAIELALLRCNAELEEQLRLRLIETVEALCNAALAPLAIDPAALASRVATAAAMLARADDHRLVRLHPADLDLVKPDLPAGLPVEPDPSLARGTIRIESAQGGVEDGPEVWRAALAEALAQC